jgi:hypothetical protein
MNKIGTNVSLTWITIAIVAFIAVFMITQSAYINFTSDNNGTIDQDYLLKYQAISKFNETYSDFADASPARVFGETLQAITGLIQTVFNIGLGSIRALAQLTTGSRDILEAVQIEFPEFQYLFWFIIISCVIYVAYRFIQSARGSATEP